MKSMYIVYILSSITSRIYGAKRFVKSIQKETSIKMYEYTQF